MDTKTWIVLNQYEKSAIKYLKHYHPWCKDLNTKDIIHTALLDLIESEVILPLVERQRNGEQLNNWDRGILTSYYELQDLHQIYNDSREKGIGGTW
jgi:hypothetical protein